MEPETLCKSVLYS